MGYSQIHLLGSCTVCKPFCMLTDSSKHFILYLHSHWLVSQITTLISCMLRCIVSLSHLIHNKCRIVIAVHVDTILHILDLISSRKEICLRCDHCSAWEHDMELLYYYMMRILFKGIAEPDMSIGEIMELV